MNKFTSTLAGLALVAGVSVAPAFAQGNLFSPPGTFTFLGVGAAVLTANTLPGQSVGFNAGAGGANTTATFSLSGSQVAGSPFLYNVISLTVTPAVGNPFTETAASGVGGSPFQFTVFAIPGGTTSIASVGAAADGTTFNLVSAPVPEASTTASFGLLALGLGGLMIAAKRKKMVSAL